MKSLTRSLPTLLLAVVVGSLAGGSAAASEQISTKAGCAACQGKGVWGAVPMMPTDARKISDAELKALLAWVLKTPG